jgi:signal peptide peptidase SppA
MRDAHLKRFFADHPWAIIESYGMVIAEVLERRALGVTLSDDDLAARIGPKKREKDDPDDRFAISDDGIALLPLHGVISHRMNLLSSISGGTSTEQFGQAFQSLVDNPGVRAIVFDVDSPGGSVYGLDELHAQIMEARGKKPILAHVNHLAGSAAFWLASAADRVTVTPSGDVGSVGVFAIHQDQSEQEANDGIKTTVIRAGKYKAEGNPHEPLSDDARKAMQERVDGAYERFVGALATGFGLPAATIKNQFGQGRIIHAGEALKRGMVHDIGTRGQALSRLSATLPAPRQFATSARATADTTQDPARDTVQDLAAGDPHVAFLRDQFSFLG